MKKFLAILSCAIMLSGTLAFTACDILNNEENNQPEEMTEITAQEAYEYMSAFYEKSQGMSNATSSIEVIYNIAKYSMSMNYNLKYLNVNKHLYVNKNLKLMDVDYYELSFWRDIEKYSTYDEKYDGWHDKENFETLGNIEEANQEIFNDSKSGYYTLFNYLVTTLKELMNYDPAEEYLYLTYLEMKLCNIEFTAKAYTTDTKLKLEYEIEGNRWSPIEIIVPITYSEEEDTEKLHYSYSFEIDLAAGLKASDFEAIPEKTN